MFVKELLMKPLYCNAYEESICLPAHQQSKSISDFVRSPLSFNILLHYSFLKKKKTNRKMWSNNNTEQQNLKQDLYLGTS